MSIKVQCPNCHKKLSAKDAWAGMRVKCPGCQQPLSVPASPSPSEPPKRQDSVAIGDPGPLPPSPSTHTDRPAVIEPPDYSDSEAALGEIAGTYSMNAQDAWQTIVDCVRGNSAYELIRDDPVKREVIFRMRAGRLIVTAKLVGEDRPTDLRMAFDDREASATELAKIGKALPLFQHLPPVEAGKRVAEAGAKAVLTTALQSRAGQVCQHCEGSGKCACLLKGSSHGCTSCSGTGLCSVCKGTGTHPGTSSGALLSSDSRLGAAVLIALGILAVGVNLVLLAATSRFFPVILAVCPSLFMVGIAGLVKPEVASFLLCDMKLAAPPPGGFSKAVKGLSLTLFFIGAAIGLLIVVAAINP